MAVFAHLFGFYVWNWVWTWDILTSQLLSIINQTCLLPNRPPKPPNHTCLQLSTENVVLQLRKHCALPVVRLCAVLTRWWTDSRLSSPGISRLWWNWDGSLQFLQEPVFGCSDRTKLLCILTHCSWKAPFSYRPIYTSTCKEVSFFQVFDWTSIYVCISHLVRAPPTPSVQCPVWTP